MLKFLEDNTDGERVWKSGLENPMTNFKMKFQEAQRILVNIEKESDDEVKFTNEQQSAQQEFLDKIMQLQDIIYRTQEKQEQYKNKTLRIQIDLANVDKEI